MGSVVVVDPSNLAPKRSPVSRADDSADNDTVSKSSLKACSLDM